MKNLFELPQIKTIKLAGNIFATSGDTTDIDPYNAPADAPDYESAEMDLEE